MDKYSIVVDICSKFFSYVRIEGWLASDVSRDAESDKIDNISISNLDGFYCYKVGLPSEYIGPNLNKKFTIDLHLKSEEYPEDLIISFKLINGLIIDRRLDELRRERMSMYRSTKAHQKFERLLKKNDLVLDLGGRNRSGLDRSSLMENRSIVFDIINGDNVDVVGDAHELSKHFSQRQFDAVMSMYVFEHLAMPWKVIGEINHVLKLGGFLFIHTHQTVGLHDMPWDFFRFSEDVWPILLNKETGFEIVDYGSDFEQFVIPFIWHPAKKDAEKSAGREASWVIAKKCADIKIPYPVNLSDVIDTSYPEK